MRPFAPIEFPVPLAAADHWLGLQTARALALSATSLPAAGLKLREFPLDFPEIGNSAVRAVRSRLSPPPASLSPPLWRSPFGSARQGHRRRSKQGDRPYRNLYRETMKTTLNINDHLLADAKALAAQQRTSLTRLV